MNFVVIMLDSLRQDHASFCGGDEEDELYDLVEDPRERDNIIGRRPEEADRLAAMFPSIYFPQPPQSHGVQGDSEVQHTAVA